MKREGEGGKKTTGKPEIVLCREDSRVSCFLSVADGHLKACGSPSVDWKYMSPKSILLWVEGRSSIAGSVIEKAQCLAKMTGFRLRDELTACDIGRKRK